MWREIGCDIPICRRFNSCMVLQELYCEWKGVIEMVEYKFIWLCKTCGKDTVSMMTAFSWDGNMDYMVIDLSELERLNAYELYCWVCDDLCAYDFDENGVAIS